jgi:hypothetical protein
MKYEDIFNLYNTEDKYRYYNILRTVNFPKKLIRGITSDYTVKGSIPYTALSYNIYKTPNLWWLICLVNNIKNPVKLLEPGVTIKIIKPENVDSILSQIQSKK